MMRCEIFTDPFYGSERYIEFDPGWVVEAKERTFRLFPFRKYPVTDVTFKNGKHYVLRGNLAAQIAAERNQTPPSEAAQNQTGDA